MKNICILSILFFFFYNLSGQNNLPFCLVHPVSSSSLTQHASSECFDYMSNYNDSPILNVYINVHITISDKNESPQLLAQNVHNFIDECNRVFDNAQPGFPIGNPPTYSTPWIPKAKIRLKLYSDLSARPDDQYGGIWIYPFTPGFDIKDTINTIDIWSYQNRYGAKVLDYVLVNRLYYDNTTFDHGRGITYPNSTNGNHALWVSDLNRIFWMSNQPGNNTDFLKELSRTANHELAHCLSLSHAEYCLNECGISNNPKGDINPVRECGPVACPNIHNCADFNPGLAASRCGDPANTYVCTWGNGTLLCSQGFWNYTITPCQWGRMFNYVLDNQSNTDFYKLCHTSSNYTLPTSPEREYRASQSITSTSAIAANRDVDYFSPTTTLNPGFAVALGAHFLAYPALFSCCINGTGSGERGQESAGLSDNAALKVAPNPFDGAVDVDFTVGLDAENVNLYMTDINGRVVKSVFSGEKPKGSYKIQVKTNDLPNGFYLLNLHGQNRFSSKKVVKTAGF